MNAERWALLVVLAAATSLSNGNALAADPASYEPTAWAALMPPNWEAQKILDGLNLDNLSDGDPEAQEAMKKLRVLWDNAPSNAAIDRRRVRLSGYMVPLEFDKVEIREFLLVPYFGACIHSPGPPGNQMVHVRPAKPVRTADRGNSAVTVSGTLYVDRAQSEMGVAGYRMAAELVRPYMP